MTAPSPTSSASVAAETSRPRRTREIVGTTAAAVVAFGLGWWIQPGRGTETPRANDGGAVAPASTPLHSRAGSGVERASDPATFAARFAGSATTRDLAAASRERDELRRDFELGEWAQRLRPDEFPAEFTTLAGKYPGSWDHLQRLLTRWASLDPAAALAAVQARPITEQGMLAGVISGWAVKDSEAAFAWIRAPAQFKIPNEASRMEFFISALIAHDRTDEMVDFASRVGGDPAMETVLTRVAATLARRDPDLAQQWFTTLPPGPTRERVFGSLIATQALTQPESALQTALDHPAAGERSQAILQATRAWASSNPEAALAWATPRRADARIAPAIAVLIPETLRTASPTTTESLLDALPADSPERTRALLAIIPRLALTDHARAVDYALRYSTPVSLANNLTGALQPWIARDPAAAIGFIAGDPRLTEAQRQSLRQSLATKR